MRVQAAGRSKSKLHLTANWLNLLTINFRQQEPDKDE